MSAPAPRSATSPHILADLLRSRGQDPAAIVAIRNVLHTDLVCDDFRDVDDLARAGILHLYDRMQDGPRIAHDSRVLSFAAMPDGRARLSGFRRFLMRRPGIVPADILYDHDGAHLLHGFITHAAAPVFYDVTDESGLDDLRGHLVVRWPEPATRDILPADHPGLQVAS